MRYIFRLLVATWVTIVAIFVFIVVFLWTVSIKKAWEFFYDLICTKMTFNDATLKVITIPETVWKWVFKKPK
jgi:hypothetical protein